MTAPDPTPLPRADPVRVAALWAVFVVVHAWLWIAVLIGPHTPLNDVTGVYRVWVQNGQAGLGWVGLNEVWVYPSAALLPMLAAAAFGIPAYGAVWLGMIVVLDALALAVLTRGGTRRRDLGWWWLAFLLLLGPITVGRIDSVSVPLALVGLLYAVRRPVVAGVLLGIATWIKVWPAALIIAVVVATRRRMHVVAGALAASAAVVVTVLACGGSMRVIVGFVGQQTGRALQIEAPVTTWWLWLEALRVPGVTTYFDQALLTYEVAGPGERVASMLMTPIMVVVMAGLILVGVRAVRRGAEANVVLAPLALALVTAFIVTNKVGSPQYETWLAVPVLLGLLLAGRGGPPFRAQARLTLAIALLTQVIYPWGYDWLLIASPWIVAVITVRNLLLVVLLVVSAGRLWRLGSTRAAIPEAVPVAVTG